MLFMLSYVSDVCNAGEASAAEVALLWERLNDLKDRLFVEDIYMKPFELICEPWTYTR